MKKVLIVSTMASAVIIAAWIRSYGDSLVIYKFGNPVVYGIMVHRGVLDFRWFKENTSGEIQSSHGSYLLGFEFAKAKFARGFGRMVAIPLWFFALVAFPIPMRAGWIWFRARANGSKMK